MEDLLDTVDFDLEILTGARVEIRVIEPGWQDAAGDYYPGDHTWREVPVRAGLGGCEHLETICVECVGSWATDHEIRLS